MGGEIYSLEIVYGNDKKISPDLSPKKMKLNLGYVNQRLGLELDDSEAKELLEKMGHAYDLKKKEVSIPAYRSDILHQVDLVGDIAIAYGYENFEEEIPKVSTIGEEDALEKFYTKVREILIGIGLLEVKNLHLLTEADMNQKMNLSKEIIKLKNALGDYNCLRNSVLVSMLKNLSENQHNEYPQNLFEIGRIFSLDASTETGVKEKENLGMVMCEEKADYTQLKQVLDWLARSLGLSIVIKESKHPSFIPGRIGDILVNSKKIGFIGEVHPQVLENWNLSVPVSALELDLEELFELVKSKK
jgi:phenylalanyl-tRNA synthetase beta chain